MKIKPLSRDQIIISVDRLTRFKEPEVKYLRVFKDIILSNLIEPKFKRAELDLMDYETLKNYAQDIINFSLNSEVEDIRINELLYEYEFSVFNFDKNTEKLLKNRINYHEIINLLDGNLPLNLLWLKNLALTNSQTNDRQKFGLRFPLEKIVISEGITEEILLPEFAKLADYDFDKNGVLMLSAGGKNQVVKLFYRLSETLKLPVYVLLDKDAQTNYEEIKPKLRDFDMVHVLSNGEFEDVLQPELIKRSLNYVFNNISEYESIDTSPSDSGMVKILEDLFKHRGLHEFKKSEFAHVVKENLKSKADLSDEITAIISEIRCLNKN